MPKSRIPAVYILVAIVFVLAGGLAIRFGAAAGRTMAVEAESGVIGGTAKMVPIAGASNDQAVQFAVLQCGVGGPCTAAEVAVHNKRSDCWVTYSNKVYNITSYIPKHGGGENVFETTCGKDMAPYLDGSASAGGEKYKHEKSEYDEINPYYIAELK